MTPASWFTIKQACLAAQVSRRTIYNWLAAGRLETVRTAGGSLRINPASLFKPAAAPAAEGQA